MEMQFYYDNKIVKKLHLRDHCFGVVGMLVGLHWPLCFFSKYYRWDFVVELRSIKTFTNAVILPL
jgi:hypothetical protein